MKITITGQSGTGSSSVARLLADKLRYHHVSAGDIFREMASRLSMNLVEFELYVKEHPEYDLGMDKKQRALAEEHANFVLESRLGWYLVKDTFKVLITCSDEARVKRVMEKEGITEDKAEQHIVQREATFAERCRELYGLEDLWNPNHFDLTIDSTEKSSEGIASEIREAISKSEA